MSSSHKPRFIRNKAKPAIIYRLCGIRSSEIREIPPACHDLLAQQWGHWPRAQRDAFRANPSDAVLRHAEQQLKGKKKHKNVFTQTVKHFWISATHPKFKLLAYGSAGTTVQHRIQI